MPRTITTIANRQDYKLNYMLIRIQGVSGFATTSSRKQRITRKWRETRGFVGVIKWSFLEYRRANKKIFATNTSHLIAYGRNLIFVIKTRCAKDKTTRSCVT